MQNSYVNLRYLSFLVKITEIKLQRNVMIIYYVFIELEMYINFYFVCEIEYFITNHMKLEINFFNNNFHDAIFAR